MKNFGSDRHATYGNKIRRMRIACSINDTTDTHSEYVIHIIVHNKNGYENAPQFFGGWGGEEDGSMTYLGT